MSDLAGFPTSNLPVLNFKLIVHLSTQNIRRVIGHWSMKTSNSPFFISDRSPSQWVFQMFAPRKLFPRIRHTKKEFYYFFWPLVMSSCQSCSSRNFWLPCILQPIYSCISGILGNGLRPPFELHPPYFYFRIPNKAADSVLNLGWRRYPFPWI